MNKLTKSLAALTLGTSLLLSTGSGASAATYTAKSSDTLSSIANQSGTSYKVVIELNGLKSTRVKLNQEVLAKDTATTSCPTSDKSRITYTVKSDDTLSSIARQYGTTYKAIVDLNELKSTQLTIGQKLLVNGTATASCPTPDKSPITYTVKSDDTLSSIARQYGTTYKAIVDLNKLKSTQLKVGQKLLVNGIATTSSTTSDKNPIVYTVKSDDTLSSIARQHGTTYKAIVDLNELKSTQLTVGQKLLVNGTATTTDTTSTKNSIVYTVKSDDTLSSIARQYGTTYKAIVDLNELKSTRLTVGQKLLVSGSATFNNINSK